MKGRIIIVDDEPMSRLDIRDILEQAGYDIVAEAADGFAAIEECQKHRPDLVIMDIKMPLLDGLTASKKIIDDKLAGSVVLLSAYSDELYTDKAKLYGASGYLVKPLDVKSLIPTVEVCIEKGRQLTELLSEMKKMSKKLEDRIIIEQAKGQLMQEEQLSEPEAFKKIRTISMQKRVPMVEIARLLILGKE